MSYWQQRRMVELLKKAQGKPYLDIPEEIIQLEREIIRAKAELSKLIAAAATEEKIGEATVALSNLEYRMKQLLISKKLK